MSKLLMLAVAAVFTVLTNSSIAAETLVNTVQRVLPSVCRVAIVNVTTVIDSQGERKEPSPDNPFDQFLEKKKDEPPRDIPAGVGACFVIDYKDKKYIITNEHVAKNNANVALYISFYKDQLRRYESKLVAADKISDIAVLEMSTTEGQRKVQDLPGLAWSNSDLLKPGQDVFAIGHPLGLDWSVSKGIVSYNGRRQQSTWQETVQTDVAINQGNSGGPLLNIAGQVVGVNSFILSPGQGGSVGLNFSVTSNNAKRNVVSLIEEGEVKRAKLGIQYRVDYKQGYAIVADVQKDGPCDGKLLANDILFKIDDRAIQTVDDIGASIQSRKPGDTIKISVIRDKSLKVFEVELAKL